jgi:hypothetical protein
LKEGTPVNTPPLRLLFLPLLVLSAVVSSGCPGGSASGDPNLLVTPITGEASGSLSGHVIIIDADQRRLADKSGIEVTIDGFPRSAITNTSGYWSFTHLPEGTHTITWTKPGFGTTRMVGYRFPGGDVHSIKVWVVERPHFTVARLRAFVDGSVSLEGETQGSIGTAANGVRVFVGLSPGVSANPGAYRFSASMSFQDDGAALSPPPGAIAGARAAGRFSFTLDQSLLREAGFRTGDAVYVVAYADGIPSVSYTDPGTAREVFTTINPEPSPVIRVILP